tara:strand:- start:68 stop:1147 length:1080 start_codon:yes stop_codon:yes gene_type:complete
VEQVFCINDATDTTATRVAREPYLAERIVIVNGLAGCGKTMLSPIIGSLPGTELMRYNYDLETVCILHFLKKITEDAAIAMIRMRTDLDLYHGMMARETNFRFSDLSSVWNNAKPWRYLKRLFLSGDAAVIPRLREERPILNLVTHHLLGVSGPLFQALQARMTFIEVLRHPLYMIKQWYAWIPRQGVDPRVFDVWLDHKGHAVPWMALGWEDLYLQSGRMDRAIYGIRNQWQLGMTRIQHMSESDRCRLVIVPFEHFVTDPDPFIRRIESLLGTQADIGTRWAMKKQNVPRKLIADGIGLNIYKQYGWEPPTQGATEKDELAKRRAFVASEATPEALGIWDRLCEEYEMTQLTRSEIL